MRTEAEKRKERREDRIWYTVILVCVLYFVIRSLVGCTPTGCLTKEARFYQRHYYNEKTCQKRSRVNMWLVESRANGGVMMQKQKKVVSK